MRKLANLDRDKYGLKALFHAVMGIVLLLAGNVLASLPVDLFYILTGQRPSLWSIIVRSVLFIGVTALLVWLYITKFLKRSLQEFRICRPGSLALWIVCSFLLPLAVSAFFIFATPGRFSASHFGAADNLRIVLRALFSSCLAAGITEELIFRAFILRILEIRWGRAAAVGVPSVLFGVLHIANMQNPNAVDISVLIIAGTAVGVMFSLIAIQSGSIWASAVCHGVWNLVIIGGILGISAEPDVAIFSYQLLSESTLLTGGLFGIEASLPGTLGYIAVILLAVVLLKRQRKEV